MNLAEEVMHQLYQTTRSISKGLNPRIEPLGLYSSEWTVIVSLQRLGETTQAELAAYMNVEPPAISRSLGQLEKKGWIVRLPGLRDRREKCVSLSETALAEFPRWEAIVDEQRSEVLCGLTIEQQQQLLQYLKTMFAAAQHGQEALR